MGFCTGRMSGINAGMSVEPTRPYRSIIPYFSMLALAIGIMFILFGAMAGGSHTIGGVARPLTIFLPVGVCLIVLGSTVKRHWRAQSRLEQWSSRPSGNSMTTTVCDRCKTPAVSGAKFCKNCGQRVA